MHDQSVTRKIFGKMIKSCLSPVGNALRGVPGIGVIFRNALVRMPYNHYESRSFFGFGSTPHELKIR